MKEVIKYAVIYTTNSTWLEYFNTFREALEFSKEKCAYSEVLKVIVCEED